MKKSSLYNIDANIIILICYLGSLTISWFPWIGYFSWLLPFAIYLLEKENQFIQKHALQAIIIYFIRAVVCLIINIFIGVLDPIILTETNQVMLMKNLYLLGVLTSLVTFIDLFTALFVVIVTIKTWNYVDYNIPGVNQLVPYAKKIIDKLNKGGSPLNKASSSIKKPKSHKKKPNKEVH